MKQLYTVYICTITSYSTTNHGIVKYRRGLLMLSITIFDVFVTNREMDEKSVKNVEM